VEYLSPTMEPVGGSDEVVPQVTLAGAVYAVVVVVGATPAAVYNVVVAACGPYWDVIAD